MLCFPPKVNFLILWNYRQVRRNPEYWECAIISCKPLTPTHSPFTGSGWLIQVNFREKITLKKYPPPSQQLISPGYREGFSLTSPCLDSQTSICRYKSRIRERKPLSVADPSSSGVFVLTQQSGSSGCSRIRRWLKSKCSGEFADHLLCACLFQLSYSFFTHSGKICEQVPLFQEWIFKLLDYSIKICFHLSRDKATLWTWWATFC